MNTTTHAHTTLTSAPPCKPEDGAAADAAPAQLLTPEQLARRLGISRRSLANWSRDRIVPMIKIGRICRFDPARVRAALEQYEQVATPRNAQGLGAGGRAYDGISAYGALQSFISTSAPTTTHS